MLNTGLVHNDGGGTAGRGRFFGCKSTGGWRTTGRPASRHSGGAVEGGVGTSGDPPRSRWGGGAVEGGAGLGGLWSIEARGRKRGRACGVMAEFVAELVAKLVAELVAEHLGEGGHAASTSRARCGRPLGGGGCQLVSARSMANTNSRGKGNGNGAPGWGRTGNAAWTRES
jgi:hypothetical protein